ncbi:hypothetical protein N7530_006716 [Penicillium desertorum]|uniref:Uncharacterized protein n=1 Tax=Penicillium desertorum TaxID=1303715 RepID=A0A9X0BMF4_9EURO|nr:hypothetical protein N7530_006716 [Penicillium desertorum]
MWASNIYAVQRPGTTFDTYLESTKLLFVIAESSFEFSGLREYKAPACSLNDTPLIGSQASQAHDTFGPHSDSAYHHVHSLPPPMPLGMVQRGAVLVVRDVLREHEQIVSVCSSPSLYYRSAARIHELSAVMSTRFPNCPL